MVLELSFSHSKYHFCCLKFKACHQKRAHFQTLHISTHMLKRRFFPKCPSPFSIVQVPLDEIRMLLSALAHVVLFWRTQIIPVPLHYSSYFWNNDNLCMTCNMRDLSRICLKQKEMIEHLYSLNPSWAISVGYSSLNQLLVWEFDHHPNQFWPRNGLYYCCCFQLKGILHQKIF